MKPALDVVEGRIVAYDERSGLATIQAHYDDWYTMTKRGYTKCLVQLIDSRPLSEKQRKMCYALLREIADFPARGRTPPRSG